MVRLFLLVAIVAVLLRTVLPETHWWDVDRNRLTTLVRDRIAAAQRIEIVRVTLDGVCRTTADERVTTMMSQAFDVLTEPSPDGLLNAEYYEVIVFGNKSCISFEVTDSYIVFGDGKRDCCARISRQFVDILESTVSCD